MRFEGPLESEPPPRPLPRPAGAGIPRPVERVAEGVDDEPATDLIGGAALPEPLAHGQSRMIWPWRPQAKQAPVALKHTPGCDLPQYEHWGMGGLD